MINQYRTVSLWGLWNRTLSFIIILYDNFIQLFTLWTKFCFYFVCIGHRQMNLNHRIKPKNLLWISCRNFRCILIGRGSLTLASTDVVFFFHRIFNQIIKITKSNIWRTLISAHLKNTCTIFFNQIDCGANSMFFHAQSSKFVSKNKIYSFASTSVLEKWFRFWSIFTWVHRFFA